MTIQLSSAKVDITPTGGMLTAMDGYGVASPRESTGTYFPLYARCLVIWDGTRPHAIVTLDLLALPRATHQAIRAAVLPLNGVWSSSDFVLTYTHTHNGPVLGELDPYISYGLGDGPAVSSYLDNLTTKIVNLVSTALAAPADTVTLDYQVITQNFSANREGLSYVETAVPVLVARRAGDVLPRAILFSYSAHPVSLGPGDEWDGDYPAAACAVVEAAIPGCHAHFLTGPAADQDPVGTRGANLRNRLGAQLGSAVVTAAATVGRALSTPITSGMSEVTLPLDITVTPANMAAVRAAFVNRQNNGSLPPWYTRHAQRMIETIDASSFATTVPLPLAVWKFAGSPVLRLAFVGGELVSGYAVYFRSLYGGANGLFIVGYANEIPGYVPSNELLPPIRTTPSYAGGWDADFPGIGGGSMTIYHQLAHFRAGASGVENAVISGLNALLA